MSTYNLHPGKPASQPSRRNSVSRPLAVLLCVALFTLVAQAQLPASGSALTGFGYGVGEHEFYLGTNGNVYQMYLSYDTNSWVNQNLSALSGFGVAVSGSALTSFVSGSGSSAQEHVVVLNAAQNVYQLVTDSGGSWTFQDLTAAASAHPAASGTALSSFVDSFQHVLYLGTNQHVYQLYYNGKWVVQDLTTMSGAPSVASGSALTSFVTGSQEHAFYLGTSQHVYQLVTNSSGKWTYQDLTALAGGALAASGSALASFSDSVGQHVLYLGTSGAVFELYYSSSDKWIGVDLTAIAGAPGAATNALTSPAFVGSGGEEYAFFVGEYENVFELGSNNPSSMVWFYNDLTTGAPVAAIGSTLSSFNDTLGLHVFYLGTNQNLYELYYNGASWVVEDLTTLTE
jgi:hypothetical protein